MLSFRLFVWPFKPHFHYTNSPYWSPYILFSTTCSWENLFKQQDSFSLVIISLILVTCTCYNALMWWGEIWCWSLLGLKGLMYCSTIWFIWQLSALCWRVQHNFTSDTPTLLNVCFPLICNKWEFFRTQFCNVTS